MHNANDSNVITKLRRVLKSLEKEEAELEERAHALKSAIEGYRFENRKWLYLTNQELLSLFREVQFRLYL